MRPRLLPPVLATAAALTPTACGSSPPDHPGPSARPAATSARPSSPRPSPTPSQRSQASQPPTTTASTSVAPPPPTSPPPAIPPDRAGQVLAGLDLTSKVGQLLMIGQPAAGSTNTLAAAVRDVHVGNAFLSGRSSAGVTATAAVTGALQAAAGAVPMLIATDQEGGEVQVLSGPGFERMPTAVQQGTTDPGVLQEQATRWGDQLRQAGVDVDLGPVLDTVPPGVYGDANPPIAGYEREYGHDPATVSAHGLAVVAGLQAAHVVATGKHFPGLGRVEENTDTHAGVVDEVTGPGDPYLQPFADAVQAGIGMIMISNAVYPKLDATQPACFSPAVVTGLLRGTLGFTGVVVSDDLGAAAAVADVPVGERAVRFVAAGGDLVLDVDAGDAASLSNALVSRARADPAFAAQVDAATLHVLELKASLGLLR